MAAVKFTKGSEEWQMFMDYWDLCQKYWKPENNDNYWQRVIDDTDKFYKKYKTNFTRGLVNVLVDELEHKNT